jgi:hypothetical protein
MKLYVAHDTLQQLILRLQFLLCWHDTELSLYLLF